MPFQPDSIAISVVRRFASRDEDPRPSDFLAGEVPAPGESGLAEAYPLEDLFGGFIYVDGKLQARPSARTRQVADNLNQAPVAAQSRSSGGARPRSAANCRSPATRRPRRSASRCRTR